VTTFNQFTHLSVEKGEQQRTNVRTVDVGIGHDDQSVVTQFLRFVFILADTRTKGGDQGNNFLRGNQLVETRFLDIQNFSLER